MERYIVSARKYRPQTFETVVGQQHITNTLENAIKNNHLAQALLFCGPRGVGKTTCARILAKMINADDGVTEEDFSLNIFELDAASNNSVEDIRRLIEQVRFAPQVGRFKVYIIDEVHMLSQAAFNAFLKTLEEPPAHAIFILATTEKHKIIPTILSRCQIFDFKRITVEDIANHLEKVAKSEGIEAEPEGLHIIAQKADGALRDALSIFDRLAAYEGNSITYKSVITNLDILDYDYFFKATELTLQQNLPALLNLFNEILDKGFEGIQFINGWASHLRDLLVCKDQQTVDLLEVGATVKPRYLQQSGQCDVSFIIYALKLLNDCDVRYKSTSNQRLLAEVTLMQVVELLQKKSVEPAAVQRREAPKVAVPEPKTKPVVQILTIEHGVGTNYQKIPAKESAVTEPAIVPGGGKTEAKAQSVTAVEKPDSADTSTGEIPVSDWMSRFKGKTSGISLKGETAPDEKNLTSDSEKNSEQDGPEEIFSEIEFEQAWKDFLKTIEGRKGIHSLLVSNKPLLRNLNEIHFTLVNKTQESYLQEVMTDLLQFLRNRLRNFKIAPFVTIEAKESERKPYTSEERFKAMTEINPALESLRKSLDLDFE